MGNVCKVASYYNIHCKLLFMIGVLISHEKVLLAFIIYHL